MEGKESPTVVFISGLSGTGKSTLVNYFNEHPVSGWSFNDFDKGGYDIPKEESKHLEWRKKQTDWWLQVALKNALEKNLKTVVLGLSLFPENTYELPSACEFEIKDIHFALINTDDEERKKRLYDRGTPHHWQGKKEWYGEFYEKMRKYGEREFDTTNKNVEDTALEIINWLKEIN